jgi:hypothetical protein
MLAPGYKDIKIEDVKLAGWEKGRGQNQRMVRALRTHKRVYLTKDPPFPLPVTLGNKFSGNLLVGLFVLRARENSYLSLCPITIRSIPDLLAEKSVKMDGMITNVYTLRITDIDIAGRGYLKNVAGKSAARNTQTKALKVSNGGIEQVSNMRHTLAFFCPLRDLLAIGAGYIILLY